MSELFSEAKSRALRINAIVRKEIKSLISDKIAIFVLFLIPVALIVVLGTSEPRQSLYETTVWIIDFDHSEKSQEFIATMKQTNEAMHVYASGELAPVEPPLGYDYWEENVTLELAEKTLPTEYLDAYIVIPKGFQQSLAENGTTTISIYYDSIDLTTRIIADSMILLGLTNVQLDNMIFERDVFYFPESRPNDIMEEINILQLSAPIFTSITLFFSMQLVTTQAIVGDIPLKRLLNTSLRRGEVITGKVISYSIIAVFQIIITIVCLQIFNVSINCLWIDLFIMLVINSISGITIGIFLSTISKTRLQASQLFLMFFFVMIILEYQVRNAFLLRFIPIEQAKIAFANLAFRGESFMDVRENILNMVITGAFFYILTIIYIKYFKKEFV